MMTLWLFVATSTLAASVPSGSLLSSPPPDSAAVGNTLRFSPASGHHFNLQAPQKCGESPVTVKKPGRIECTLTIPGRQGLILSICDESNTFCKIEKFTIEVTGQVAPAAPAPTEKKASTPHAAPAGFIKNDTAQAIATAKSSGKPLLIDFSAIWCPPCGLYEELVFPSPKFKKFVAKNFVAITIDVDDPSVSSLWKERFKITGYPTLVVANSDLQEIGRVVGFRPLENTLRFLQEQAANKNSPIETSGDSRRMGFWKYDRQEWADAAHLLEHSDDPKAKQARLSAQAELAKEALKAQPTDPALKKAALDATERLLIELPHSIDVGSWFSELNDEAPETAKKYAPAVIATLQEWLKKPKEMSDEDFTSADLYFELADLYETLGQNKEATHAYARCAQEAASDAMKSRLKLSRGANQVRAACLLRSGDAAGARALYEKLIAAYGHEFTFHFNYANALKKLKELDASLKQADMALEYSYGDNRLRTVLFKTDLLKSMKKCAEARDFLKAELATFKSGPAPQGRAVNWLERMEKSLADVEKCT